MAELLLLNPRKRRARRAGTKARRRRNPVGAVARRRRRRNPVSLGRFMPGKRVRTISRARRRRRNPVVDVGRYSRRRRRNPIGGGSLVRSVVAMTKEALIGGAGAVAIDVAMGYANKVLPASLQRIPGKVGVGDAVKVVLTVAIGKLLSRPTRGMSMKAAQGALIVQARDILQGLMPAGLALGYVVPANVVNMNNRVGPVRRTAGGGTVSAYVRPGATPLLSRVGFYDRAGGPTPLLNRVPMAREREQGAVR